MSDTIWAELRKPFPVQEVGKLPRVTCGDCSDRRKTCTEHKKAKCSTCGAWVSTKHIHIDYVGHADVTSRLLAVDPEWNWEPAAEDEHGLPVFDTDDRGNPVGLWIKLTVGGVTRLGYGSAPSDQPDVVKVLIGDALRNAAMRFGVALDLWAKGDRANPAAENATASAGRVRRGQSAGDVFADAAPAEGGQRRAQRMSAVPDDDPWYGASPESDAKPDAAKPRAARPRATRPEAAKTDPAWLELIVGEMTRIKTREDGEKVWAKVVAAFNDHTCTPSDRQVLEGQIKAKVAAVLGKANTTAGETDGGVAPATETSERAA